jgi:hypothetical protein
MKAYELIDSPDKWTKGEYASLDWGKYCAVGAYWKAYGPIGIGDAGVALGNKLKFLKLYETAENWNDNSDWQTVYNTLKELDI